MTPAAAFGMPMSGGSCGSRTRTSGRSPVRDLERDPLVAAQHRYYVPAGIAMGIGLPVLLGWAFGDPWGGFIVAGAVRLLLVYHATFAINSIAHCFGAQPYSDQTSSRDNLLTALVSMGEGYHNFHHAFCADYRNGAYAHQFDPTKWVLWSLAKLGVVRNLRRTPPAAILRARMRMDERRLATALALQPAARERLEQLRATVDRAAVHWRERVAQYEAKKDEAMGQGASCFEACAPRSGRRPGTCAPRMAPGGGPCAQ